MAVAALPPRCRPGKSESEEALDVHSSTTVLTSTCNTHLRKDEGMDLMWSYLYCQLHPLALHNAFLER